MSTVSLPDYEIYAKYPVKYDQGYFNELKKLSIDNLIEIINSLSEGNAGHLCIYNGYKELSTRIYDDLSILNYDNFTHDTIIAICVYLSVLADKRNDIMKKNEIKQLLPDFFMNFNQEIHGDGELYYNFVSVDINPNRETVEILYNAIGYRKDLYESIMSLILLSVSNSRQYPQIIYETFVDVVRFLVEKYAGDCNDFFRMFMKRQRYRKYVSYIASALVRICGKNFSFSELALKGQIISHIPEGYYQ